MIVRTYGRRNRSVSRSCSDSILNDEVSDEFRDSSSQESPQDVYNFTFSSQDSSAQWPFSSEHPYDPFRHDSPKDSHELAILPPRQPLLAGDFEGVGNGANGRDPPLRKSKKPRNLKPRENGPAGKKLKSRDRRSDYAGPTTPPLAATATLMETQEFGEMMEHVDEVNFALDGLRRAHPVRIRRASLLTLLSICVTAQQRRLLKVHGMAKTIIDTILGLSLDDSPSNLASATLFYILTSDGQDDYLLDSPSCIRFLLKLLKPQKSSDATKDKELTIGSKLLALRKDGDIQDASKGLDSSYAAIMEKVQEILVNCKEMKSINELEKLKLTAKWIALLTMEKACLSTLSLEDSSGTVRRTGGNFKERLRELGGLDAVFEVARTCHSTVEHSLSVLESKDNVDLESLVLLLKCLKIMENATFLSNENQSHLLQMKGNLNSDRSPKTFPRLVLSFIKILSGISLRQKSSSGDSNKEKLCSTSNGSGHTLSVPLMALDKVDNEDVSLDSLINDCIMGSFTSQKSFGASEKSVDQFGFSKSTIELTDASTPDPLLLKMRLDSSRSGSCSGTSNSLDNGKQSSRMNPVLGKRMNVSEDKRLETSDDNVDPFAFDEDEIEPSKWDLLSGKKSVSTQKGKSMATKLEDKCQSLLNFSMQESAASDIDSSLNSSCSSVTDEEKSNFLADCLLTAVKALMNLTNDNADGCRQIAACEGLETLSSLIAGHFPLFGSHLLLSSEQSDNTFSSSSNVEANQQNDRHLTDQELDFLVAILGLLVNLVEKDSNNRSRLAAANVSLPDLKELEGENQKYVIPLLCSIFLANQGAGEAAEGGKLLDLDDEDALLQGEKEAEKMIVQAYSALLLAFLSTESKSIRNAIAECLPERKLAVLVPVLERFVEFHLSLNMISPETHTTVLEVIESCRMH